MAEKKDKPNVFQRRYNKADDILKDMRQGRAAPKKKTPEKKGK